MPEPVVVECPVDVWTLVAERVQNCDVWIKKSGPTVYYIDQRMFDSPAPTDRETAVPMSFEAMRSRFNTSEEVDIYVMPLTENGAVIVDLTADPAGSNVFIQDQTTLPVEYFLTQFINDITILSPQGPQDNTLVLSPGHGVVVGDLLEIYSETVVTPAFTYKVFVQPRVVAVAGDIIRTGQFLGFDLVPVDIVFAKRMTDNMNIDAALDTPERFRIGPPNGFVWDLTRLMIAMVLDTAPDDGLFGNLLPLANGVFFGAEGDLGSTYLVNIFVNAGFRLTAYDVEYTIRSGGQGEYGMSVRKTFAGQDKYGVAVRLDGNIHEEFVTYLQDPLSGINEFKIKVMGHVTRS